MAYVEQIIEKIIRIQDELKPEVTEYYEEGEGRISLLRVEAARGSREMLLMVHNGRIQKAPDDAGVPIHIFRCTSDTFLDLIAGDQTIREAVTKGKFQIENGKTGHIDLIECEKWAKAFKRVGGFLRTTINLAKG